MRQSRLFFCQSHGLMVFMHRRLSAGTIDPRRKGSIEKARATFAASINITVSDHWECSKWVCGFARARRLRAAIASD